MTVVVDTSVLIDHLRGSPRARELLEHAFLSGEQLAASVLTKVEVLAGARPDEQREIGRLLARLEWIVVDEPLAERAGGLAATYRASHPGVDPVDYVIAATVELLNAALWTRNVRHFPMFPGLAAPY